MKLTSASVSGTSRETLADARLRTLAALRSATVHELRGAANTLALHLQLLQSEMSRSESPRLERSLTVLDDERRRILALAEAFMGLATIPDDGTGTFDLGTTAANTVRLARPYAAQRYVRLVGEQALGSQQVVGRRDVIAQALVDLLLGLIDRTPRQGEVAVQLATENGAIHVRFQPSATTGDWNPAARAHAESAIEWAGGRLHAGDTDVAVELPASHREDG
jgi:signal transduction histidine kinase